MDHGIPLHCTICPKKPTFSDISHLLTHVSSKGHLSHYFKLQVRSRQEPEAQQALATYNAWYESNELGKLLSERMASKESKKSTDKPKRRTSTKTPKPSVKKERPGSKIQAEGSLNDESLLDPRLTQDQSFDQYNDLGSHPCDVPMASRGRETPGPTMYPWTVASRPASFVPHATQDSPLRYEEDALDYGPTLGSGPSSARRKALYDLTQIPTSPEPPSNASGSLYTTTGSILHRRSDDEAIDDHETEVTKLKGVVLPGMDIFDSANALMRRKRNQKKDGTILSQMQSTSALVKPTEMVFFEDGNLAKERFITGLPDDTSPIKGESPQFKKQRRPRIKKPALAEKNVNNGKLANESQLYQDFKGFNAST